MGFISANRLRAIEKFASGRLMPSEPLTRLHPRLKQSLKPTWIAAFVVSLILVLTALLVKLDGHPHTDWQQFLGRFHPAVVHLPIAILLLVPLFELAAYFRPTLRETALMLLLLALPVCVLAVLLGYLLAYGSGTSGAVVTTHLWSATILTIVVMLCLLVRPSWTAGTMPYAYPVLLACAALLTAWTGHQGGSITYGKNYLIEYAPFGTHSAAKTSAYGSSFYSAHLQPVFDANCVACHSDSKIKGGLRLDSYSRLMKGGEEGFVIVAGKPDQSALFKRITLPPTDKHFMPTDGKSPLKLEEIAWIKAWIQDGASETAATVAGVALAAEHNDVALPQVGDYSKLAAQIATIEKALNIRLGPVSMKPGDGLILNAVDAGLTFGDAQLAQLDRLAPYIVEAELGRTSVTDASFDTLAKFTHLRALHVEDTAVTGTNLNKLTHLAELSYLNLSGTKVTQAAIASTTSMKSLHHLYVFNTPAQPTLEAPHPAPTPVSAKSTTSSSL